MVYKSPKGKFVKELKVFFEDDAYVAQGINADGEKIELRGNRDDSGVSVDEYRADTTSRISFRTVAAGKRMVVSCLNVKSLMRYTLAWVKWGYSQREYVWQGRSGSCLYRIGWKGTMPVNFEGQTYYVCCTGCRDYFNENAAAIVAEYASKKRNRGGEPTSNLVNRIE